MDLVYRLPVALDNKNNVTGLRFTSENCGEWDSILEQWLGLQEIYNMTPVNPPVLLIPVDGHDNTDPKVQIPMTIKTQNFGHRKKTTYKLRGIIDRDN